MNLKTPSKTPLDKPENTTNSEHQLPLNLNPEQTGQRSIEWAAGLFEGEGWLCRNGRYSWELAIEMTDKEKLQKEYDKIVGEQIQNNDIPTDMYPIMSEVLAVAIDYIPNKVLKRIIERNKKG